VDAVEIETPHGIARVHLRQADDPRAALVIGHGAGGGVAAPDLITASDAALSEDVSVALVEQPYRVLGRRAPPPARQLDAAWLAVTTQLLGDQLDGLPLIAGGRSMGARVACRTAGVCGAIGVLCLAFPLQPPRRAASSPATTRLPELDLVTVPTLVVQGDRDPFGIPPKAPNRSVVLVPGDHSLRKDGPAIAAAVSRWLQRMLPPR
jgi:uncharacterized protein